MKYIICGAGQYLDSISYYRFDDKTEIVGIYDNDPEKWHGKKKITILFSKKDSQIFDIEPFSNINVSEDLKVLIMAVNSRELKSLLIDMGLESEQLVDVSQLLIKGDLNACGFINKRDLRSIKENQFYKRNISEIKNQLEMLRIAVGRLETHYEDPIEKNNVKVFSQWNEDGIIQYIIRNIDVSRKTFVEFGVENYTECNTRFLLVNNNWNGLVIDGSDENINYIKKDDIYWRYNLKADCRFITAENINEIMESNGIVGKIGLLSVDIDGNDYWVWKAIDAIEPDIVVCEYNSLFGLDLKVTTPYQKDFIRSNYDYSNIVYGASISALVELGKEKGYCLVAGNSAGNNLFFVKSELCNERVFEINKEEAYRIAQFREARDKHGNLTFADFDERAKAVKNAKVFDLSSSSLKELGELMGID